MPKRIVFSYVCNQCGRHVKDSNNKRQCLSCNKLICAACDKNGFCPSCYESIPEREKVRLKQVRGTSYGIIILSVFLIFGSIFSSKIYDFLNMFLSDDFIYWLWQLSFFIFLIEWGIYRIIMVKIGKSITENYEHKSNSMEINFGQNAPLLNSNEKRIHLKKEDDFTIDFDIDSSKDSEDFKKFDEDFWD